MTPFEEKAEESTTKAIVDREKKTKTIAKGKKSKTYYLSRESLF